MTEDIKGNDEIKISEDTQKLIASLRAQILQLQQRLGELLTVVFNESGKEGDYQPNEKFTQLELIKKKDGFIKENKQ